MRIADFLKEDLFCLPIIQPPRQDFKQFVFRKLDDFIERLTSVHENLDYFHDLGHYPIGRIKERQEHLVNKIKRTLDAYYNGHPSAAYHELSDGLMSNIKNFTDVLHIRPFVIGENFYRIRLHKENFPLEIDDFFHIPFEKRGLVKTQRFSIPGFPSLYLGASIYVCWEELNRPNINDFQAVRLESVRTLNLLDLAPPETGKARPEELYDYLMTWPLVMACSVKVRNYGDTFKPEYIIPQLLLQWVRENEQIDGISYQTTHMEFVNSLAEGEFINIVLPVKDNKSRGLCDTLKSKFKMTNATSIQLSQCTNGGASNFLWTSQEMLSTNPRTRTIEIVKGRLSPYGYSILGGLERSLKSMETWPIGQTQEPQ